MKFFSVCFLGFLGLLVFASAQQNLRAISAEIDDETLSLINTSIFFQGIKAEHTTSEDTEIIENSIAAALDQVYGGEPASDADSDMLGSTCRIICRIVRQRNDPIILPKPPTKPVDPTCGGWGCGPNANGPSIYVFPDGRCTRCPDRHKKRHILGTAAADKTSMVLVSMEGKIPESLDVTLHQQLEEAVCDNMRSSGSKALEAVHDCQVYFYALEQAMCATSEVLIKIEGVAIQDKEEFNKIEMAATAAGLENITVEMVSGVAADPAPVTFVLAAVEQSDNNCNANVDATAHSFCANLHDHGFEAAHSCEIAAFGDNMMVATAGAAVDLEVA